MGCCVVESYYDHVGSIDTPRITFSRIFVIPDMAKPSAQGHHGGTGGWDSPSPCFYPAA